MTDSKEELFCPACNTKMVKINTEQGLNIDICTNGCGGIWFDNRELEKFDENFENAQEIENCLSSKDFKKVDTEQTRICPVCKTNMVKHKVSMNCDVEIDECYTCGGKFLDYQELNEIRKSALDEQEQINTIVNALYTANNIKPYRPVKKETLKSFLQKVYLQHCK